MKRKHEITLGTFVALMLSTEFSEAKKWLDAIRKNCITYWEKYQKGQVTEANVSWILVEVSLMAGSQEFVDEVLRKAARCGLNRRLITSMMSETLASNA